MDREYGMGHDLAMGGDVEQVRLNPGEDLLAVRLGTGEPVPRVELIELVNLDVVAEIPLDEYSALFATDMAIRVDGEGNATVYLALPNLGQILALRPGATGHALHTAGASAALFLSPDESRLYAVQPQQGRVSVIDVDCEPQPGCERVLRNLDVSAYPAGVVFHPTGKEAYVTHAYSNTITVID
jgi:hypothetical protein